MADDVLSQSEIDKLLSAISTGDVSAEEIKKEDEQKKELLAISNCRDAKNKQFWLIHYVNKVTVPPAEPVNIEELSNELDALLNS